MSNQDKDSINKKAKKKKISSFWVHFGFGSLALGLSFLVWFITTIL